MSRCAHHRTSRCSCGAPARLASLRFTLRTRTVGVFSEIWRGMACGAGGCGLRVACGAHAGAGAWARAATAASGLSPRRVLRSALSSPSDTFSFHGRPRARPVRSRVTSAFPCIPVHSGAFSCILVRSHFKMNDDRLHSLTRPTTCDVHAHHTQTLTSTSTSLPPSRDHTPHTTQTHLQLHYGVSHDPIPSCVKGAARSGANVGDTSASRDIFDTRRGSPVHALFSL